MGSPLVPTQEKKAKMQRKTTATSLVPNEAKSVVQDKPSGLIPEKRPRKKWSEEETQMLVTGCNIWGVGNWKAILNDPSLKFDNRSPVDLKDRFRTFFPDAYKLHYPNAKTHLSSKIRSTLPDGTSIFEKTRSKKRRPFTSEEDQALKAGYEKYGTVWSTIVKDPIFQEQKRRSTDLRDRFRNAFPHLYQAAGYKPRSQPKKKKRGDASVSAPRATADDQLLPTRMATPAHRRRSRTTSGYSYSVPQSTAVSEDEDSSDDDDEIEGKKQGTQAVEMKEMTPQPDIMPFNPEAMLNEVTMHTIEQFDDLAYTDYLPDNSQSLSESATEPSLWSPGQRSPIPIDSWSSAATTTTASPTSSHLSVNDHFMEPSLSTIGRREGMNMIGKSAWDPSDWLSGNPRLDPSGASSSNSSYADGQSPPPASPFSFSHLSHGIMDRYDLFQNSSFPHDFASEVGASDAYSTFSDPELFPTQSMRGFTHHSNYAGDLIFGARTHQPLLPMSAYTGLGLSGIHDQPASINPMQLHTPSLPGIDELAAIRLDDDEPMIAPSSSADVSLHKEKSDSSLSYDTDLSSLITLPPQTMEEIVGLSSDASQMDSESAVTPPATPALGGRSSRELHNTSNNNSYSSLHSRSMSVPPFERAVTRPPPPAGHATPQPAPTRSLSLFDVPPLIQDSDSVSSLHSSQMPHSPSNALNSSYFSTSFINDSFKSLDLSDLIFLDLHAPSLDLGNHESSTTDESSRKGQALDLAHMDESLPPSSSQMMKVDSGIASPVYQMDTIGRSAGTHHRVQSQTAVSPKDLFLNYNCNGNSESASGTKNKRASWGGSAV